MNERSETPKAECICENPDTCRTCQREAWEAAQERDALQREYDKQWKEAVQYGKERGTL